MAYINLPLVGGGAATWKDSVANFAALPIAGNTVGDARVAEDTGIVYAWDGAAWQSGVGSTSNSFSIIQADTGTTPVADSATDTLTLTSPNSTLTINGDSTTDSIEFDIPSLSIVNALISASAAINYSKMEDVPSANILVGNGSNKAAAVAMTGAINITNTGVTSISTGVIVDADINATAAIARSKLASGSADHVVINSGAGLLSSEAQLAITRGGTGASSAAAARTNLGAASTSHKSTHVSGGSDAFAGGDLLDATARVTVRKNTGADVGTRRRLNFIEGTNVTMTIADDAGSEETDITINAAVTPTDAQYIVLAADPTLTNERVLTGEAPIRITDSGAGLAATVSYDGANLYGYYYEDFILGSTPNGFSATTSGSGASLQFVAPAGTKDWGVVEIDTGTTSTGRAALATTNLGLQQFGASRNILFSSIITLDAVSDGTQRYTARIGFIDSATNVESTDAIMFRYLDTENSGNWSCITRSNNTETSTDSGVPAIFGATNYVLLEIYIIGTSSVEFYINGTLVATNTTNIPSGSGRETGVGWSIVKSVGGTSRYMRIDFLSIDYFPSSGRV